MKVSNLPDNTYLTSRGTLMEHEARPTPGHSLENYQLTPDDEAAIDEIKQLGWNCINGDRYLKTIDESGRRVDALIGMIDDSATRKIMPLDFKLKVSSAKNIAGFKLLDDLLEKYHDTRRNIKLKPPNWFTDWTQQMIGLLAASYLPQARRNLNQRQKSHLKYNLLRWHSPTTFKSEYS